MENRVLTAADRLSVMKELLTCGDTIYMWTYDLTGRLLESNCSDPIPYTIFEHAACKELMIEHFNHTDMPIILGSHLGLMWCAVREPLPNGPDPYRFIVAGPVLNSQISREAIKEAIDVFHVPVGWRTGFMKQILSLPVVATTLYIQYALMMHYCATGEKLTRSNVDFQKTVDTTSENKKKSVTTDRFLTYYTEQQLLRNVREGNPEYSLTLENASRLSSGIRVQSSDGLGTAVISCTSFVSLCVRAAIEGGLSPDTAYTIGDSYIQKMIKCTRITDLRNINHMMYDEFIQTVRHIHQHPSYSKSIQSCIDYIEMHLTDDLSVQRLAQRTGYAEYYLTRKFREETNQSLKDFICSSRVRYAQLLLETTDLPISRIAQQLHFCSSGYFSSHFRKETGMTPKEYRNVNKKM